MHLFLPHLEQLSVTNPYLINFISTSKYMAYRLVGYPYQANSVTQYLFLFYTTATTKDRPLFWALLFPLADLLPLARKRWLESALYALSLSTYTSL